MSHLNEFLVYGCVVLAGLVAGGLMWKKETGR